MRHKSNHETPRLILLVGSKPKSSVPGLAGFGRRRSSPLGEATPASGTDSTRRYAPMTTSFRLSDLIGAFSNAD